jgi:hypothetical protein
MEPYPVFDNEGKVRSWLDAGRGVAVWPVLAMDSSLFGSEMLTPGDHENPPNWKCGPAGTKPARILGPEDVAFFHRVMVERSWTETAAGWKAANRYLGGMSISEKHSDEEVPIGRKLTRYTVERFRMESDVKVHMPGHPGRPPVIPGTEPYDRPLHTEFRIGVVRWVCIIPKP